MIVDKTNPKYSSNETCSKCDETFHTDGTYEMHTCPHCGEKTPACNVCKTPTDCELCPLQTKMYKVSISTILEAKTEKQVKEMFFDIIANGGFGSPDVELMDIN